MTEKVEEVFIIFSTKLTHHPVNHPAWIIYDENDTSMGYSLFPSLKQDVCTCTVLYMRMTDLVLLCRVLSQNKVSILNKRLCRGIEPKCLCCVCKGNLTCFFPFCLFRPLYMIYHGQSVLQPPASGKYGDDSHCMPQVLCLPEPV